MGDPKRIKQEPTPALPVPQLRSFIGGLAPMLQEKGISRVDFRSMISEVGYPVPRRTLDGWVQAVRERGYVVSPESMAGRPLSAVSKTTS